MYKSLQTLAIGLFLSLIFWQTSWATDLSDKAKPTNAGTCQQLFHDIDKLTQQDAQSIRIGKAPYLRSNRFLSSFQGEELNKQQLVEWLEKSYALGKTGWQAEMTNASIPLAQQETAFSCANEHINELKNNPENIKPLLSAAQAPDNYIDWKQIVGLYPLMKIPVQMGVNQLNIEIQSQFQKDNKTDLDHKIYTLFKPRKQLSATDRKQIISNALTSNTLGIPLPTVDELDNLFSFYAPAIAVETKSHQDKIVRLQFNQERNLQTNSHQPSLYTLHDYTRIHDKTYLQLIYVTWFPARPADHPLDIYSGFLDGLMWRVTLDHNGDPLLYDSVHPCGCYHKIYPVSKALAAKPPEPGEEIAFILNKDIPDASQQPVLIHVNSKSHFVTGLTSLQASQEKIYTNRKLNLTPYNHLRSIPVSGGHRSLFQANGLIAGTQRKEQWLIWPMGVEEAGAMRQWGTHATAFVSRRHFDEARLFERFFSLE